MEKHHRRLLTKGTHMVSTAVITAATLMASVHASHGDAVSIDTVAACLILEAGGEGDKGMWGVMCVIKNRAKGSDLPAHWKKVATKKQQFSCFNDGLKGAIERARKHPKWDDAVKIVQSAMNPFTDYTYGATHYHVCTGPSRVTPYWTSPKFGGKNAKAIPTIVIGKHVFLKNVD